MAYRKTTQNRYVILGAFNGINNFDSVAVVDTKEEADTILKDAQEKDPEITFKVVKYRAKLCPECTQFMDAILTVNGDWIAPWEKTSSPKDNIALWKCPDGHEKEKKNQKGSNKCCF